jgi:hypothetical protein
MHTCCVRRGFDSIPTLCLQIIPSRFSSPLQFHHPNFLFYTASSAPDPRIRAKGFLRQQRVYDTGVFGRREEKRREEKRRCYSG